MHDTLIYASIHKHTKAGQDRNQAVCALQTEPIVCRWAFNGPTAGHKEHTAVAFCCLSLVCNHRHRNATIFLIYLFRSHKPVVYFCVSLMQKRKHRLAI